LSEKYYLKYIEISFNITIEAFFFNVNIIESIN